MEEQDKLARVLAMKGQRPDTEIRKEIGKLWGLRKTARNDKFRKLFGHKVTKGDTTIAECPGVKTADELFEYFGLSKDEWNLEKFTGNIYGQNVQSKGEFKRKLPRSLKLTIEDLKADLRSSGRRVPRFPQVKQGEKLLLIGIADLHAGKFASKEECGHDYNLEIAKRLYLDTLDDLIEKSLRQGPIDRILFVMGNDFLNIDSAENKTTSGTPQDVDGKFPHIFREGRKLLVEAIDTLKTYAPVDVIVSLSNHDRNSCFHLADALECWYHNDENVTFDNTMKIRKYYEYGGNSIGITHGDTIKVDKLPMMGLNENGEQWGKANRRYWVIGHFHHLKCQNISGTEIWTLPSISGSDSFHQAHGYIGSTRCGLAMIFNKDSLEAVIESTPVHE